MSARDVIANQLLWLDVKDDRAIANSLMRALTASGYRILGPEELDPVTVEKCAEVAKPHGERPCGCEGCYCDKAEDAERVAAWDEANTAYTAIRALYATHQEVRE